MSDASLMFHISLPGQSGRDEGSLAGPASPRPASELAPTSDSSFDAFRGSHPPDGFHVHNPTPCTSRAVPPVTATEVGAEVAVGAAVRVAGEAGEADLPPPGWRHCSPPDGGYVRLQGGEAEEEAEEEAEAAAEEAEAAAEAAAVAGGVLTPAVCRGFDAPPPGPSVAPRVAVPLAQLSSSESNGRADTPYDVAQTQFALKTDFDVRSNPCLLSTRV